MGLRNIDNAIKTALANRDPLLVYHLVKFEKPSQLALEAEKAIDYVYLTDAPYAVTYEGQEYHPGGLLKVGKVPESTEAKATNLSLTLSTTKLGKQSGVITVSTSGIAASADGELTVNLDLFKSGFYPGDVVRFDPTNSGTAFTVRINRLHSDGTKIGVTNLGTNAISSISNVTYRANFDSSEVDALTSGGAVTTGSGSNSDPFRTSFSSTSFDNYINRSVSIFRVFANPTTGAQIGTPVLLFKGIIAKGTLNEKVQGAATMTWSLTSHWGDFVRINGRITSDEFHRGLDSSGNSSEDAAIRPEYVNDLGFAYADRSLNVLASYTDIATRGKSVRRGGLAGFLGGKKYKEEKYEVTRELDLSINLDAKYIPLVYGVQRVDPIPVFADVIITQDANSQDNVATGQTDLFQAQVLCEGPIGGVYDIYMEDKGLVCKDDQDSTARTGSSSDVPCLGKMDRGTVLSGQQLYDGLLQNDQYGTVGGIEDPDFWRAEGVTWIQGRVFGPNTSFQNSRTGTDGVLHGESFRFPAAKNIQLTVHTGKEDQEVDQTLFGIANAEDFLVQQQYFTDDKTKYWTANHRLLDSAYVVTRDTITAEDGRSPSLSFVVRGKFINCHSYDGSYKIAQGVHTSLELGDTATITLADGSSGGTAQVIDKWYFVNASKVTEHRVRFGFFNTPATETAILNNTVGKFTAAKAGTASVTFISPEYSNDPSAPVAPTTPLTFAGFVFAGSNFTNKSIALQRIVSTVTTQIPIYGGSIGEPEIVGFTDEVRRHYTYTLNFSGLPTFTQNALKVAKEVSHLIEITLTANSNTETLLIIASQLDSSTMIYTFTGLSGELESLFGNPGGTAGTTSATATNVSFVNRRMLLQNASDSLNPTDANGLTIEVTQEDISSEFFSVKTPTTSALQTFCNTNNILPLSRDLPTKFTVTSAKYAYGVQGSHLDVEQLGDFRVSINPAMQLLDYLTSDRYGKGLKIGTDLDLDSFKEVARSCDTRSNVTLMFASTVSVTPGDKYRYPETGALLWQGTVESSSTVQYIITNPENGAEVQYQYTQVVFKDIIGKLGRKWNTWYHFETNELVWTKNGNWEKKTGPAGTMSSEPNSVESSTVNLRKVHTGSVVDIGLIVQQSIGTSSNVVLATNIGNPFVKQVTGTGAAAKIISGYSLYDSDDVKYWKYIGWDNLDQRFVTRHQTNATIDTSQSLFDNVNSMLRQFNAILRYSNGKYFLDQRVKAKPITEFGFDETITDDDIIGDIKISDKGIQKTFNSVNAQIIDPSNSFEPRSIAFYNSEYKKQDKNIPRQGSFEAPGISNYFNARMNIKQTLDESRAGLDISFTMSPRGYLLLAGNLIAITNERFNWVKKLFRIENLNTRDDLLVDVVAREHNDNAYLVEAPPSDLVIQYNTGADAKPPVRPLPPSGLTATNNGGGGIELNWTNASNYKDASHTVEIYRSANTNWADRKLVGTTKGDSFTDQILNTGAQQRYYWIRYSIQSPRPGTQSIETINSTYHPLTTGTGVSGNAISITTDELDTGVTVNNGGVTFPNTPSGTPVIRAGITTIDTGSPGFFFGYHGGSYKFQVGDPSGSNFKFDGTNLSLTGSQFSVAAPGATAPSISGTSLSGKGSLLKADGDVFFGDASGFNIFFDQSAGTLTLTGEMVTENNIVTSAITADKIAANSINADKIAANSITTDQLAANSITTDQLAANSITANQIAANSINSDMITANSVVSSLIAASTIQASHIKSNSIVSTLIAATSVTASDINTATLSALSADLGDVTAGTMKGGSIPDANAAPGGSETGAFMDLTNGKMVFGNASKHVLFDGTNLILSGVTIDANSINQAGANLVVKEGGTQSIADAESLNFTASDFTVSSSGTEATISLDSNITNKLAGIEALADVTDTTNVVAALTAGTNITIAADGTISSTFPTESIQDIVGGMVSGNTESGITVTYDDAGNSLDFSVASQTENDFTTVLKNKLDGIEAGATADQTASEIRTLVGSATNSNVFTDTEQTKLAGVESGATGDQTAAEIRTLVGNASDSNVFTDNEKSKLAGVEASATADQTAAEIRTLVGSATDSNVFTDDEQSKLSGIANNANNYVLPVSTTSNIGGVQIGYSENGQNYPVELSANKAFVNVPWVNTQYSQATSGTLGLVKIGYTENGKNYPVELSSGQMYVNVPWVDTNTVYTAGSGLSLSGSNQFSVNTTVVRTSGTQTIAGNKTFSNNIVISGDLTVSGTTTYINTTNLNVGDNIITLNADFTGSNPTESAGIEVERGTQANVLFQYKESGVGITGDLAAGWSVGTSRIEATGFYGTFYGDASNLSNINADSLSGLSTADLAEDPSATTSSGTMYFTNARARAAIAQASGGGISYNSSNGQISVDTTVVRTSSAQTIAGTKTFSNGIVASGGMSGFTLSNGISGSNFNITGVNELQINDPGEGIKFTSGSSGNMILAIVDNASDNILRYSGTNAVFDVQGNITLSGTVDGRDIATDGSKLDGIAANANNFSLPTNNVTNASVSGSTLTLFRQGTSNITFTDTNTEYSVGDGGLTQKNFTTTLKDKLDAIETNATADQTASEIRTLVGSATDSNVFTDDEKSKLAGIAASATNTSQPAITSSGSLIGQTAAQIRSAIGAGTVSSLSDLNITSTATEINKLDGFTGVVADLNYAKSLRATGVTSTEFDYLDGVTSNIQTQLNGKQASGSYLTAHQDISGKANLSGATFTGDVVISGGAGGLTITNSDIRSNATSTWTGNPGTQGKIQYHSNRWYIVADSSSNRIVQFRKNDSDKSYINNNGKFMGDTDQLDGQHGSYYLDYTNFTNTPTIPSAANNTTITLNAGNGLTTGGAFTTDQGTAETITFAVGAGTGISVNANDVAISNTGVSAGTYGSSTAIPSITVNAQGQITSATTNSITVPDNPAITTNGSTPSLASGITAEEIRSLIGAGTSSTNGDITGVTAGTGLSGGATSGNATINIENNTLQALARGYGWEPTYGAASASVAENSVYWDLTEKCVVITGDYDTTIGAAFRAVRVKSGETIRFTVTLKASAADSDGLYLRLYQHNGDMPDGKTHVSNSSANGSPFVQEDDSGVTGWVENQAAPADWTTFERDYTPSADGYVSLVILNWSGMGNKELYVRQPDISKQSVGLPAVGSLFAEVISANTINANRITANTITAAQIQADAINAAQISAGAITAEQLQISNNSSGSAGIFFDFNSGNSRIDIRDSSTLRVRIGYLA